MTFELHPRLAADTLLVADLVLSRVLLMNDARFAWLILVPRRAGVSEMTDLATPERAMLIEEIAAVSSALKQATNSPRLNVAALGNIVPQLHVHVVARFTTDAAWPGPVWGYGTREPYAAAAATAFSARIAQTLSSQDSSSENSSRT